MDGENKDMISEANTDEEQSPAEEIVSGEDTVNSEKTEPAEEPVAETDNLSAEDDVSEKITCDEAMSAGEDLPEEFFKQRKKGLWWKILLIILGSIIALSAIAGVVVWKVNDFYVQVTLNDQPEITLEVGQSYSDPGATGYFAGTHIFKEPMPLAVETQGAVDTATVGDYSLEYSVAYNIDLLLIEFSYHDVKTRVVHVVDTQAPVITLISVEGKTTIPGEPYEEEGYQATDNYDGDITELVQSYEQDGKVYYSVSDSSGNTVTAERIINYYDPIAPELVLKGDTDISIVVGGSYSEPGYTASDNYDGDITAKVTVSGKVDTNVTGTYTLEYSVTDSYNNTTTVKRIVRIYSLQPAPDLVMPDLPMGDGAATVVPSGKVVYLKFDDGPSAHTSRLLDVLDMYGVKATFFVVNTGYLHLLPRIVESGHTVAIHCYSHKYEEVYYSDEAYFNDLYKMQSIIQSYTGVTPTLLRFPGGSSNKISRRVSEYSRGIMSRVTQKLDEMGYKYFDWNVDSGDAYTAKTTQEVINNVIGGIKRKDCSIVLQHDIKGYSVDAVETIIEWGLANGYTFLPLDSSSPGCHQKIAN